MSEQAPTYDKALTAIPFLPGMSMHTYLDHCRECHPALYRRLDVARLSIDTLHALYRNMDTWTTHFENKEQGGRGDAYRAAQQSYPLIRAPGIKRLLELATPDDARCSSELHILDVLGGNGTVTRANRLLHEPGDCPTVFTADASASMIADALQQGLPAVRQPAHQMLFGDQTVDGVIFAYGTHHIQPEHRQQAIDEAWRILRPKGRIVLQDFEEGTPTARWYSTVLDTYTLTGHQHTHFTREGMYALLVKAGFKHVEVLDVYDPCVVYGATAHGAKIQLLNYLISLFALEKLLPADRVKDDTFWQHFETIVREHSTFKVDQLPSDMPTVAELTVLQEKEQWRAELPRVALVAVGER